MPRVINESADAAVARQSPGYLMAPFGWAAKPLAAVLEPDLALPMPAVCVAIECRASTLKTLFFSYYFQLI
jgi:hypothetical protein